MEPFIIDGVNNFARIGTVVIPNILLFIYLMYIFGKKYRTENSRDTSLVADIIASLIAAGMVTVVTMIISAVLVALFYKSFFVTLAGIVITVLALVAYILGFKRAK